MDVRSRAVCLIVSHVRCSRMLRNANNQARPWISPSTFRDRLSDSRATNSPSVRDCSGTDPACARTGWRGCGNRGFVTGRFHFASRWCCCDIAPVRFEKVWIEQCRPTRAITRRFGAKSALDYLIGAGGRAASKYECDEFRAVDRALTTREIDKLRTISSRAVISRISFSNDDTLTFAACLIRVSQRRGSTGRRGERIRSTGRSTP